MLRKRRSKKKKKKGNVTGKSKKNDKEKVNKRLGEVKGDYFCCFIAKKQYINLKS
jgi:hypothetical protein